MERLFEIDLKDYKETDNIFRRPSARAIIIRGDKIALVYSKKEKYYKFPGGGIHDVENSLVDQELDDYENEAEFVLRIVNIDTAIEANDIYKSDIFFNEVMIKRDLRMLRLIKGKICPSD